MSGWIKLDKTLTESLRFKRLAKELSRSVTRDVTRDQICYETIVLGALTRLWLYADTHISDDNLLEATLDEVDEIVGVQGFAKLLPVDWLKVIDANHVELPDFLAHNGTSARQRKQGAVRQARYRHRKSRPLHERDVTHSDASRDASNDARPDQTRPRPDQKLASLATRALETAESAENFARLKAAYPAGTYRQSEWLVAEREVAHRLSEGHNWPDLHNGVDRYLRQCQAKQAVGTQFVLSPAKFFAGGPMPKFLEPYPLPATKADTRLAGNLSAAEEFMRRTEVAQ